MTETQLTSLALVLFLALDLVTVSARAALARSSLARLLVQRGEMETQVKNTVLLFHSRPRTRASLNMAQTLWHVFLIGLGLLYLAFTPSLPPLYLDIGILLIAALVLFWLEWGAEIAAARNAEAWALRLTPFVRIMIFLMAPFVALPLGMAGKASEAPGDNGLLLTEEELKTLVDAGEEEGVLEEGERQMIDSIFELGDTLAREIMVPRIDVLALDVNTSLPDGVEALLSSGHSRLPVYEETVDHILGLLYAKDLLRLWRGGEQGGSLRDLLRPAYFVPEAKKVDELLAEMQSQRIHMAIVVDEYGGVAGLVTLEDIVEEILGEIQDEYDQGEESPYQELAEGKVLFQGRVDLDEVNELFEGHLPTDEADTLGGFIYGRLGRVPVSGERIQVDNLLLTVEQITGRRIRKVLAERIIPLPGNAIEEEETHADG
jgi:CBS domain containing-hemolysin-like protein